MLTIQSLVVAIISWFSIEALLTIYYQLITDDFEKKNLDKINLVRRK